MATPRRVVMVLLSSAFVPPSDEVVVCEPLRDALTFSCAGFRHAFGAYGAEGFAAERFDAVDRHGVRRVL
jgi:DNA primase